MGEVTGTCRTPTGALVPPSSTIWVGGLSCHTPSRQLLSVRPLREGPLWLREGFVSFTKSSSKHSAWNLQLCLYSQAPETLLHPKLGISIAWPLLCASTTGLMIPQCLCLKILTGGNPASASLALSAWALCLDRATVFSCIPEAPGLFSCLEKIRM